MVSEAVLYVHDLETMAGFYQQHLGLAPVGSGEGYCGIRAGSLVLWLVRGQIPQPDGAGGAPTRRAEVPVKLGFEVASIDQAADAIAASGCWVKPGSWTFAGYCRRDAADPEGNIFTLLEPVTDGAGRRARAS